MLTEPDQAKNWFRIVFRSEDQEQQNNGLKHRTKHKQLQFKEKEFLVTLSDLVINQTTVFVTLRCVEYEFLKTFFCLRATIVILEVSLAFKHPKLGVMSFKINNNIIENKFHSATVYHVYLPRWQR